MCWCAQLMIQCETRLAFVLWRFQIKSTLHNSLFTTEFFSNLKKFGKRKTSYTHTRQMNFPDSHLCPSCSPTHFHFWYNFFPQSLSPEKRLTASRNWDLPWVFGIHCSRLYQNFEPMQCFFHLVSIYDSLNFNFLRRFGSFLVNSNKHKIWLALHKPTLFVFVVCLVICLQVFTDYLVVSCGFYSIQHLKLIRLWWFQPWTTKKFNKSLVRKTIPSSTFLCVWFFLFTDALQLKDFPWWHLIV